MPQPSGERRHHNGLRKLCSCSREKWAKCAHPWHFNYRTERFSADVQAGSPVQTKADADALARTWRDEIDKGTFVRRERGGPALAQRKVLTAQHVLTLDVFASRYLEEYVALKRGGQVKKDRQHPEYYVFVPMRAFVLDDGRRLGGVPFAAITEEMYAKYVSTRRQDDYAASTVNKDVTLIKEMCRWAARRRLYGPHGENPLHGETKVLVRKKPAERQRPILDEELEKMRGFADPLLWAFTRIALITCLRLTELYRIRWSDVFCSDFYIRVRPEASKNETSKRKAPLNAEAVAILEYLRIDPAGQRYPSEDYVFGVCGEAPKSINDRFNTMLLKAFPGEEAIDWANGVHGPKARARLDQINLVFGDLRHEGALRKYRSGWKLNEIQALLGHTSLKQTTTYLGVGSEEVLRAMREHGSGAKVLDLIAACNPDLQSTCNPTVNVGFIGGLKKTRTS